MNEKWKVLHKLKFPVIYLLKHKIKLSYVNNLKIFRSFSRKYAKLLLIECLTQWFNYYV